MNDMHIQDRVKRLYQQYFGGGHMITDPAASLARLQEECALLGRTDVPAPLFEALGGGLCRMNLRPLRETGLSLEAVNAMFVYSANAVTGDMAAFRAALDALSKNDTERRWVADYTQAGCPAISHSEAYRTLHQPAYRVVLDIFEKAFPLILRMDSLRSGILAIDGPCASGKSTLGQILSDTFGLTLLHMDDFFLRPEQRTPARFAEPGGNVDRERFAAEVLAPLRRGLPFSYRPFDCGTQSLAAPVSVAPTPLSIVEGAYSLHPDLRDAYALTAFCRVAPDVQRARLLARNGAVMLQRFEAEWIPLENRYFSTFGIEALCDVALIL